MQNKPGIKTVLIGAVILLISVGTVFGFRRAKEVKRSQNTNVVQPIVGKMRGPDSAPIRILDFSDFQCPACRTAAPILEMLMEKYPGKIQLVFKHFPLRMHVWSPVAHQSAECASQQGKFWEFYRKMYEYQPVWSALPDPMVSFVTYAKEVGLNTTDFGKCLTDSKITENILAEKKEGEVLEVKSTPTFFINGKMFAGPMELQIGGEEFIRKTLGLPPLASAPMAQPAAAVNSGSAPAALSISASGTSSQPAVAATATAAQSAAEQAAVTVQAS